MTGRDLLIRFLSLLEGELRCKRNDAAKLGIEPLQTRQIDPGQSFRSELSPFNPTRELCHGRVRYVFIIRGQWSWIVLTPDELIAQWTELLTR
jgi:hypothetical protein